MSERKPNWKPYRNNGWEKTGERRLHWFTDEFNAVIFGAAGGYCMWAWGVWAANQYGRQGIEHSLAAAKRKALEAIQQIGGR